MMSSDKDTGAQEILSRLINELDGEYLHQTIDARIDDAASRFPSGDGVCRSHQDLLQAAARFVRHLYKHGLRVPQALRFHQACAEAVSLLERAYRGAWDAGYEAALLDAVGSGGSGLVGVLAQIAEAVKLRERESYTCWVCAKHLIPCGWRTRCEIAKQLLTRCGPFLPARIRDADPAEWADDIPRLLRADSDTNRYLNRSF